MKLRTWLNMAPYTVENLDDSNNTGMRILGKHPIPVISNHLIMTANQIPAYFRIYSKLRIFVPGVCIQDVKDAPCFCVLINGDGELAETLTMSYFRFRDNGDNEMAKGKRKDIDTLQDFLLEQKPHVIAICCESRYCCKLFIY